MTDKPKIDQPVIEHAVVMDKGSSLLPMLIAGLVMITLGMALAFAFI